MRAGSSARQPISCRDDPAAADGGSPLEWRLFQRIASHPSFNDSSAEWTRSVSPAVVEGCLSCRKTDWAAHICSHRTRTSGGSGEAGEPAQFLRLSFVRGALALISSWLACSASSWTPSPGACAARLATSQVGFGIRPIGRERASNMPLDDEDLVPFHRAGTHRRYYSTVAARALLMAEMSPGRCSDHAASGR
jgi:hypothetical protein